MAETASATGTDLQIYASIANPSKTDIESVRERMMESSDRHARREESDSDSDAGSIRSSRAPSHQSNAREQSDREASSDDEAEKKRSHRDSDDEEKNASDDEEKQNASDDEDRKPEVAEDNMSSVSSRYPEEHHTMASFADNKSRVSAASKYTTRSRRSAFTDDDVASEANSTLSNSGPMRSHPQLHSLQGLNMTSSNRGPPSIASSSHQGVFKAPNSREAEMLEKQTVLLDMERLKLQGITFTKTWTVHDRLDDMQFELRRHLLHLDEINNINMLRDGLRMACTGFEMVNKRYNLLDLDGWSQEVCRDMTRYDHAMSRLYRKYWRRSSISSPEMELAMALCGSIGMYHFKQKMASQMFPGSKQRFQTPSSMPSPPPSFPRTAHVADAESSEDDEEEVPP